MSKWQTLQMSGELARYELSHLNLHCLQTSLLTLTAKELFNSKVCLRVMSGAYPMRTARKVDGGEV